MKIQFVWWGLHWVGFHVWAYPVTYKSQRVFHNTPIFFGLCLGIVEIRYFPDRTNL